MSILKVEGLRCEYRMNPLGIDVRKPRISWKIDSDRRVTMQKAYRIQVAGPERDFSNCIWDTGIVESDQSIHVEYSGPELKSRTRYYYRVKVWDNYNRESEWSETAWWEMGLLETDEWKARWITPDANAIDPKSDPVFLFRKRFELTKDVASARIYATAAGVYEVYVNGERISDDLLAPGWTSYHNRIQYQTYDVTDRLQKGSNGIGIMLGDGWYRSGMGFENRLYKYGERRAALLQLHVQYTDGSETVIVTDTSWKASTGPILYSNIYHGETYDARLEQKGWSHAEFNEEEWKPVEVYDLPLKQLVAQENVPTRVTETIRPISAFVTPSGDHVLDMGQNMVGRIRFTVNAPAGTRIVLKHAEVLDREGNIYFGNLRSAKQTVEYITKGEGEESYAPHFTFMGFRYVKVEGYPDQEKGLPLDAFVGEVIHSDMEPTGEFECSNDMVNRLQSNIQWGQRGNFVDVPTDCPQRDERLGWTGDAQVFIRTALFNYQGGPFFTKWLRDLKAEQLPDGGVPFVIPSVVGGASSAAWGDAAVICPWTVYLCYGDTRLLAEQYESMKAWVEYIRAQGENEYLWNTGFHFGDWLALDAKENSYTGATPKDLIATAFYAYSTSLLIKAAKVLGKTEDVRVYEELHRHIVDAFRKEYITPAGRIAAPTQTAYVLALMFDLVEESVRARVAHDLNELIVENDYNLTTGFVGTPYLCHVLSDHGYHETAVRMLFKETYPGWLYSISKGATTIWEHWDSIKPDGSFWSDNMNSFNHYAYGAIGDWMYRKIAGLDMDETKPPYKRIRIQPLFAFNKLTYAKASHLSMYGMIESAWSVNNGRIEVRVRIPANTTAEIVLPGARANGLLEGNQELQSAEGILSVTEMEQGLRIEAGSGSYRFVYTNPDLFRVVYDENTRLEDLLEQEETNQLLKKHFPELFSGSALKFVRKSRLGKLTESPMLQISSDRVKAFLEELATVKA